VRLPSASLLLSRLSEFTVFRRIYSASYSWRVPDKRGNRTCTVLVFKMSGYPTPFGSVQLTRAAHIFPVC
jgi:hypothetical protein